MLQDQTRQFLTIEGKEDTTAKLREAQGKPTKNYLFAPELNAIVDSINLLRNFINISREQILQMFTDNNVLELNTGDLDVISFINADDGQNYDFAGVSFIRATVSGETIIYVFSGMIGIYGFSHNITANDLIEIYNSGSTTIPREGLKLKAKWLQVGDSHPTYVSDIDDFTANGLELVATRIDSGRFVFNISGIQDGDKIYWAYLEKSGSWLPYQVRNFPASTILEVQYFRTGVGLSDNVPEQDIEITIFRTPSL